MYTYTVVNNSSQERGCKSFVVYKGKKKSQFYRIFFKINLFGRSNYPPKNANKNLKGDEFMLTDIQPRYEMYVYVITIVVR